MATLLITTLLIFLAIALIVILYLKLSRQRAQEQHQAIPITFDKLSTELREELAEELSPSPPIAQRQAPELPAAYGVERLILLTRDPYWLFAYWEINYEKLPARASDLTLKVINLAQNSFEFITVGKAARNWYINVGRPGHKWQAELGYFDLEGKFHAILRSNMAETPPDSISPNLDYEWHPIARMFALLEKLGPFQAPSSPWEPLQGGRS